MKRLPSILLVAAAIPLLPAAALAQSAPPPDDADVEIPAEPAPPPPAPPSPAQPSPAAPEARPAPRTPSAPPSQSTPPSQSAPPSQGAPAAPSAPSAQAAAAAPTGGEAKTEVEVLREELRATQRRLAALEARAVETPRAMAQAPGKAEEPVVRPFLERLLAPGAFRLSAYVQAQYENHQDSEDQVLQGGVLLNQDRFLVRRGRLRLDAAWQYAELGLELDGSTTRGPIFGVRRAEASLLLREEGWDGKPRLRGVRGETVPRAMLTFGLSEIPFGFELVDSARERVFMERSTASLAFFPGEPDVGVRLSGGLGFFRYALAILNGEPVDDRPSSPARDPNGAKDLVARLGADTRATEALRVSGGVSALHGTGFHAGQDATKGTVQWRDLNENSAVDPGEVTALPGSAATPSQNFTRWAVGLDAQIRLRTPIGEATLYGEAGIAQNLDRGLFVADPIASGVDVRHFFYYGAFVQEITRFGLAGFRVDHYNPNADFLDPRGGKLVPTAQGITTLSPVVGLVLPERARLLFQYDAILDALTRDARGVPADLKNDRWTLRLQVEL